MKEDVKHIPLRIFNLSHPLMKTELLSLIGDKYASVLPAGTSFVSTPSEANVICWDGVMTKKFKPQMTKFLEENKAGKVLLLTGEPQTLAEANPAVEVYKPLGEAVVTVFGWNVLPEELIAALIECHKKINHV